SVEPLRSANMAVTVLRSPSIASSVVCSVDKRIPAPDDDPVATASELIEGGVRLVPHFLQNRAPALTGALQAGQGSSSLRPHCSQKAESGRFTLPQFEHRIGTPKKVRQNWLFLSPDVG